MIATKQIYSALQLTGLMVQACKHRYCPFPEDGVTCQTSYTYQDLNAHNCDRDAMPLKGIRSVHGIVGLTNCDIKSDWILILTLLSTRLMSSVNARTGRLYSIYPLMAYPRYLLITSSTCPQELLWDPFMQSAIRKTIFGAWKGLLLSMAPK